MDGKKLGYIDVCKGIGIIAVVVGHVYDGPVSRMVYMFHMPLFFFIGGYLFKVKPDIKAFLKDKVIQLFIPYAVFLLGIYSYMTFIYFSTNPVSLRSVLNFIIRPFLGGLWLSGYATVFWFVPVFFLAQQALNIIIQKVTFRVSVIIILFCLVFAYLNSYVFIRLPWDVNVVLMALPLFFIGYYFRFYYLHPPLFVALLAIAGAVYLELEYHNNHFDMKVANYGIPLISLLSALAIIYIVIYVSKLLDKIEYFGSIIGEIGKASMVVMFLHQPIQLFINERWTANENIRFVLALTISLSIYILFKKYSFTRALFLGSKPDFYHLAGRNS